MFGAQNFSVGAGLRAGLGRRRGAIAARAHLGRLDVGILLGVLGGRHFSFPSSRRPSDRADHFAVLPSTDTSRAGVANWPLAWRLVRVDPGRGGSCAGAFGPERASRSELGTRVGRGRGGLARGTCAPRVGSLPRKPWIEISALVVEKNTVRRVETDTGDHTNIVRVYPQRVTQKITKIHGDHDISEISALRVRASGVCCAAQRRIRRPTRHASDDRHRGSRVLPHQAVRPRRAPRAHP